MDTATRKRSSRLAQYPVESAEFRRLGESLYGRGYQMRIAEDAGVSYRTAMRWANGETRPPGVVLMKLRAKTATQDDDLEAVKVLLAAILRTMPKSAAAEIFEVATKDATDRVRPALDKLCRHAMTGNKDDD